MITQMKIQWIIGKLDLEIHVKCLTETEREKHRAEYTFFHNVKLK